MTLTDIIGYLPHRLVGVSDSGDLTPIDIYALARRGIKLDGHKPVLRPMNDLATEITEKRYNDGKTFVPIAKLVEYATGLKGARVSGDAATIEGASSAWKYKYSLYWNLHCKTFSFFSYVGDEHNVEIEGGIYTAWDQTAVFDLLHRWHFDYRGLIEQGDAVNVHDLETNPYE